MCLIISKYLFYCRSNILVYQNTLLCDMFYLNFSILMGNISGFQASRNHVWSLMTKYVFGVWCSANRSIIYLEYGINIVIDNCQFSNENIFPISVNFRRREYYGLGLGENCYRNGNIIISSSSPHLRAAKYWISIIDFSLCSSIIGVENLL